MPPGDDDHMKKKYIDKVNKRLAEAQNLFDAERLPLLVRLSLIADRDKLERLLQGAEATKRSRPREPNTPTLSQELTNAADHVNMLLQQDVPTLLKEIPQMQETYWFQVDADFGGGWAFVGRANDRIGYLALADQAYKDKAVRVRVYRCHEISV